MLVVPAHNPALAGVSNSRFVSLLHTNEDVLRQTLLNTSRDPSRLRSSSIEDVGGSSGLYAECEEIHTGLIAHVLIMKADDVLYTVIARTTKAGWEVNGSAIRGFLLSFRVRNPD